MQYRENKIPEATVQRLSIYLRFVTQLHRDGVKVVSSYDLSKGCGFKAAQVRKDFAYFGELGVRGVGSLYYLAYASGQARFEGLDLLWATVAFTVVLSVVVHGVTAGPAMTAVDRAREVREHR